MTSLTTAIAPQHNTKAERKLEEEKDELAKATYSRIAAAMIRHTVPGMCLSVNLWFHYGQQYRRSHRKLTRFGSSIYVLTAPADQLLDNTTSSTTKTTTTAATVTRTDAANTLN
ncbi:hypothetical protein PV325_006909 [Microctonus aethiopoides]|nr:hypothetical protein PV325_006909 [Microctonus aethiopoides]